VPDTLDDEEVLEGRRCERGQGRVNDGLMQQAPKGVRAVQHRGHVVEAGSGEDEGVDELDDDGFLTTPFPYASVLPVGDVRGDRLQVTRDEVKVAGADQAAVLVALQGVVDRNLIEHPADGVHCCYKTFSQNAGFKVCFLHSKACRDVPSKRSEVRGQDFCK